MLGMPAVQYFGVRDPVPLPNVQDEPKTPKMEAVMCSMLQ